MELKIHETNGIKIAEIVSENKVLTTAEEGVDLVGNVYFQGCDCVILHEKQLPHEFFDLKTRMAGEILQKFSNYRVRLAIVGDFSGYQSSKSMKDFIFESNKLGQINFVGSVNEAIERFSQ